MLGLLLGLEIVFINQEEEVKGKRCRCDDEPGGQYSDGVMH